MLRTLQDQWDEKNFALSMYGGQMPVPRPGSVTETIEIKEDETMEKKKEGTKEKDRIDKAMEKLMAKQGKLAAKRILGNKIKD